MGGAPPLPSLSPASAAAELQQATTEVAAVQGRARCERWEASIAAHMRRLESFGAGRPYPQGFTLATCSPADILRFAREEVAHRGGGRPLCRSLGSQ